MALPDSINPNWVGHLKEQFQQARPILFTGAGFSSGAFNISGENVPSVRGLKEKLWKVCFPDDPFNNETPLQDLFEHALLQQRKGLADVLTSAFTVFAGNIPEWYRRIFSMPWQRCYTLNIDNLEIATNQRFTLPRSLSSISATGDVGPSSGSDPSKELAVVHLNGTLDDVPERVTFSSTQYAERLSRHDSWYVRFAADLLTSSVIFIGTSLEESPLWQHIVMRHGRGSRAFAEFRHRSYLVVPTLDRAKQTLLAQYNVMWMPLTAEDFANLLLVEVESSASAGFAVLGKSSDVNSSPSPRVPQVAEIAVDEAEPHEFLLGQEPSWSDIQSDRAIIRDCDSSLLDLVNQKLALTGVRGLITITGTAGSGKSTSLKRLCLKLASTGVRVGWLDKNSEIAVSTVRSAMKRDDAPDVLAIDDADLLGAGLSVLVRDLSQYPKNPLTIIAVRSGRIDRVINPLSLAGIPVAERVMPHLTDQDIEALIDLLQRENRLGLLKGKTRKDQIAAFKEASGRQLLVAMIKATSGQWLEEKAVNELSDLPPLSAKIYAYVAVASAYRLLLPKDEVLIALGDFNSSNEAMNALDQMVKRRVISVERGGEYVARHRMIAEIIRDNLHETGQIGSVIQGLAIVAAAKTTPNSKRHDRPMRMLQTFLNHDMLIDTLGLDASKNLYAALEDPLGWSSHYWLQRGSMEVERGSLSLAENFLGSALGLAPDDPFVRTEWAYLQFKKAIANPTSPDSQELVKEATANLKGLIASGSSNQYPYHVLGSQGLAWARHAIKDASRRGTYLYELVGIIEEGLRKHPKEAELTELHGALKKEYLETAIPKK